ALVQMIDTVPKALAKKPGLQDLQKAVLKIAMDALPDVSDNAAVKVSLKDSALAGAHFNVGKLLRELGDTELAADNFRRADAIYEAIAKIDPNDPDVRANLVNRMQVLMQLGNVSLRLKGQTGEAPACF